MTTASLNCIIDCQKPAIFDGFGPYLQVFGFFFYHQ